MPIHVRETSTAQITIGERHYSRWIFETISHFGFFLIFCLYTCVKLRLRKWQSVNVTLHGEIFFETLEKAEIYNNQHQLDFYSSKPQRQMFWNWKLSKRMFTSKLSSYQHVLLTKFYVFIRTFLFQNFQKFLILLFENLPKNSVIIYPIDEKLYDKLSSKEMISSDTEVCIW